MAFRKACLHVVMARKLLRRMLALIAAPAAALGFGAPAPAYAQMMMLPGQFDVSPSGSALYTVPIEVPPGTAGMSPALTLDYDSGAGNGLLGVGWNLGGLPSIGRCARTIAQDGARGAVNFTANDRFCMDGQRLVVVSGAYGAANSEYRTEIEGFTKVVAYGAAGNGPAYFKAWTKSGQIIEFGNTTDSRILATGTSTARSWAANKISDTKGNYLTVSYVNNATTGETYPDRIDYTGNAGQSLSPYNSVRFVYESRDDDITQHIDGSKILTSKRLKQIKTYEGASTVVRIYELSYNTGSSTSKSRVTSIKMCDGTGTNCLPATSFSMSTASLTLPQSSTNPVSTADMGSSYVLYIGDWNGDGVSDAMTWNPSNGTNKWFVNNGSLSFTTYTNKITATDIDGGNGLYLGDWNGDGVTDVMWWDMATGVNLWYTNNGSVTFTKTTNPISTSLMGINPTVSDIFIGDWDGDGVSDLMWRSYLKEAAVTNRWFVNNGALSFTQSDNVIPITRTYEHWNEAYQEWVTKPQSASSVTFLDWTGDGMVDVMVHFTSFEEAVETCVWRTNTSGASLSFSSQSSNLCDDELYYGDWNGDGVLDALRYTSSTGSNIWYINDGDFGFTGTSNPISTATITGDWILNIGDWNADGVSDVLFHLPSSGANRWFVNDGALSFDYTSNLISTSSLSGTGGALAFGDWNGDAFEDPMFRLPSAGTNRWYYKNGTMRPDVLSSIVTGLGSATDVTYKPLTDASVYTKESTASYPVVDLQIPYHVVSRVDADNGVGGEYSSTYTYTGAKIDVSGRGFLGFHKQYTRDLQTNVEQYLTFSQAYPYIGFVEEDKKLIPGVVTLNDRDNTYAATNLGGTRRFPYLSQTTEASKDLNGTVFPTVTSSYTYDSYGNPLTVTVSTPDGASRVTTNTYSNDATNWLLGRLLTSSVASTTPDVTPTPTGCQTNCLGGVSYFEIDDVSVTEGGSLSFTVSRTGSVTTAVDVDYASADGSALAGSDYTAVSGTLSFASSEASKTVTVVTTSDSAYEADESLVVNLSNATGGAAISDSQGVGTITEDDTPPSFSIDDISIAEGGNLVFTVTKSGSTALSHSIGYASADGTAVSNDYVAVSGTLNFGPAEASKTVTVQTHNNSSYENDETVLLNLSSASNGATISDVQGIGTILNNDSPPSFSINNASNEEGLGVTFTVTKTGSSLLSHVISYATANGTAGGSDYTAKSGTLTFGTATTTQTVTVSTTEDASIENNETFYLNLSNATNGATISDSQGVGTIINDDVIPSFSVSNASEEEGYSLVFTVTRSGGSSGTNSVTFATANGTAVSPSDYGALSGTLTFTSGQTSKTLSTFAPYGANGEPFQENFYLNLSNPTGGATTSDNQGVGTIYNVMMCGGVPC